MNIQTTETTHNVTLAIDELGRLQDRIAELQAQAERLKDIVKSLGVGDYDGALFTAKVSSYERDNLDMKAVRAKLSPQFIVAHTTTSTIVSLKLEPRKGV